MLKLDNVTLLGVDCVDIHKLILAANISEKAIQFHSVKLLTHFDVADDRIVNIKPITSLEAYSEFMIKELYKYVDTAFVLVIQADGFVLNPKRWSETYLSYDYIGAPVSWGMGNGGFSLRSKKLLQVLANEQEFKICHPEDLRICKTYKPLLESKGIVFAPSDLAQKFSVENNTWNGQFGFHNADIALWDSDEYTTTEEERQFAEGIQEEKDHSKTIQLSYVVQLYLEDNTSDPLEELIKIYSGYSRDLLKKIHFVFVDDCSPIPIEIPEDTFLNYTLLRIKTDITWNQGGARNLGVKYAKSENIIVTDLDIVFPENLLERLVDYQLPNNAVFKFNTMSNFKLVRPHVNVFFMSRATFMKSNGVDEAFSGHYGMEDIFFFYLQKALGTKFYLYSYSNIVHKEHKDSDKTQHNRLKRTQGVNEKLIDEKLKIIESSDQPLDARSELYLNFKWELVKEHLQK
ncbi:DUF5672 family protein [Psychroserpens sp. BH13MA-6]